MALLPRGAPRPGEAPSRPRGGRADPATGQMGALGADSPSNVSLQVGTWRAPCRSVPPGNALATSLGSGDVRGDRP